MQDENKLVQRIQKGDRRAFEEFLDSYGGRVHRLVRRYVDNATDAEDVTQEIFCDLYRSIGRFRGESALATWVYRVALNHCLKHCQRQRPANLPYEEQNLAVQDWKADPERAAAKLELASQVQDALKGLSQGHYDVVVLCEMQGLTYQECAKALDIPVGTVKSRLFNAFRRLRDSLRGYLNEDGDALCPRSVGEATP